MMSGTDPDQYLTFRDPDIELYVCTSWGDYNTIVVTDNGDDTVNIETTFKSMLGTTVVKTSTTTQTNVDNSLGTYTAGTTYEAVGIKSIQCNAVQAVNIRNLTNKKFITLTSSFPVTTPIYGIEYDSSKTRKADCSAMFDTDTGHTMRIYLWYGYYGYVDGSNSYGYIYDSNNNPGKFHNKPGTTFWTTFFDAPMLSSIINNYVTFNSFNGYRPGQYTNCPIRIIIDEDDEYIPFEDVNVWTICCNKWGDYKETVITDNGDDTVDITVTVKSMLNASVNRSKVISTRTAVDNTGGTYTAGTTKEPIGISIKQAAAVTSIGSTFTSNTSIVSFMELPYFIGSVPYDDIHFYYNGQNNSSTFFYNCTSIKKVKIPEGVTKMQNTFRGCSSLQFVDLPSTVTTTTGYIWNGTPAKCVICRALTPPTFTQSSVYGNINATFGIYVPDESVDIYKSTSRWSESAAYIKPLSQFETDYPNGVVNS